MSQGLNDAQYSVLAPLQSIGTDILVTRVVGATNVAATSTPTPQRDGGFFQGPGPGGFFGPGRAANLNAFDIQALEKENDNVVTDLSKLGKPGAKFTRDFFVSATLLSFSQDAVAQLSSVKGVAGVTGALTQLASHQTGTVPEIVATFTAGGQTIERDVRPPPLSAAERNRIDQCFRSRLRPPSPGVEPAKPRAVANCLPAGFGAFRFRFRTPLQTLTQALNPPQTDITSTSYSAAGIDPGSPNLGLVTTQQLTRGRWLSPSAPDEVLISAAYASKTSVALGSKLAINGTNYTVVGIVNPTLAGASADVYFPLATLQTLAGKTGRVTQVLVKTKSAGAVEAVTAEIKKLLPGAEVVTTKSLADQVTGSLADAKKLADRLGTALGIIVLAAAFVIAVLLTLGSIAKRVREIGTLRAIGWSKRRVVGQMLSETVGIAFLGGVIGIGIGLLAAFAVGAAALTATTSGVPNASTSSLADLLGSSVQSTLHTATVTLKAPVHPATLALGVGFALLGGLIAGSVGGWRASRLSPAVALRSVG